MSLKRWAVAILVGTVMPAPVTASAWDSAVGDGQKLLTVCQRAVALTEPAGQAQATVVDIGAASVCYGYLQGFRGGYDAGLASVKAEREFCAAGTSLEQLARVVVKALEESPQHLHGHSTMLMLATMLSAFPCPPS